MSEKYPGGLITKTPITPAGPYQTGAASGVWTRDQQLQYQQQGIWPTAGLTPNYIEDVFSTYLYTGNDTGQSITNGINLSGKGGLVWQKKRNTTGPHQLIDTVRGSDYALNTNNTNAQGTGWSSYFGFASNGYTLTGDAGFNTSPNTYVSWTFRKQPNFFDVVTTTISGTVAVFNHNLGSTPGCVFVKSVSNTDDWAVWHRSFSNTANDYLLLNSTAAVASAPAVWNVNSTSVTINYRSSGTYVAYVFAHNAGGFGLTGTDNVITCGSYTSPTSGTTDVNLGYEPQFLLVKSSSASSNWVIVDAMRGFNNSGDNRLSPDTSAAESVYTTPYFFPTATGFSASTGFFGAGSTIIYIAIRRGPMATPTDATKVFSPIAYTGNGAANQAITTGFVPDVVWWKKRSSTTNWRSATLLAGVNAALSQNLTAAEEVNAPYYIASYQNTGFTYGSSDASYNTSGQTYIADGFSRAPGFFDVVCYTGTGSATTQAHNLSVVPELMIVKARGPSGSSTQWRVYSSATGATQSARLNQTDAFGTNTAAWNSTAPTSSVFTVGTDTSTNEPAFTFVAYLFATCAGVSKVGSYTGNGTTQTINCGFTGGARFVLIKRTDSTGDWYVYDTARGMTTLTDPYLLLNSSAAESATLGSVTTVSTGFALNSTILAAINVSGGTYIFLAIA